MKRRLTIICCNEVGQKANSWLTLLITILRATIGIVLLCMEDTMHRFQIMEKTCFLCSTNGTKRQLCILILSLLSNSNYNELKVTKTFLVGHYQPWIMRAFWTHWEIERVKFRTLEFYPPHWNVLSFCVNMNYYFYISFPLIEANSIWIYLATCMQISVWSWARRRNVIGYGPDPVMQHRMAPKIRKSDFLTMFVTLSKIWVPSNITWEG